MEQVQQNENAMQLIASGWEIAQKAAEQKSRGENDVVKK
jgi:hypothetical protein